MYYFLSKYISALHCSPLPHFFMLLFTRFTSRCLFHQRGPLVFRLLKRWQHLPRCSHHLLVQLLVNHCRSIVVYKTWVWNKLHAELGN